MPVNPYNLQQAVQAAVYGPEIEKVLLGQHEFNVKPVQRSRNGNVWHVSGDKGHHISHHMNFPAPDDKVYYSFSVTAGQQNFAIENARIEIDHEGWSELIQDIVFVIKIGKEIYEAFNENKEGMQETLDGFSNVPPSSQNFPEIQYAIMNNPTVQNTTEQLLDGSWEGEAKYLITHIALATAATNVLQVRWEALAAQRPDQPSAPTIPEGVDLEEHVKEVLDTNKPGGFTGVN